MVSPPLMGALSFVARAAKVQSGWFRNGSHDVGVDHPLFREFTERQAIVSTTPLGLAHGLSAYLKEYPHGCTEQITSRAYPWLVLKDDANFGIEKEEAVKAIATTMNQLARRQGRNGGFGYWSTNSQEGFDYLTVGVCGAFSHRMQKQRLSCARPALSSADAPSSLHGRRQVKQTS